MKDITPITSQSKAVKRVSTRGRRRGVYGSLTNAPLPSTGERFIQNQEQGFIVRITTHDRRRQKYIGYFKNIEDAVNARDKALSADFTRSTTKDS